MSYLEQNSPGNPPRKRINSKLFNGIILSYWDNIMGPRVEMVWEGNEELRITKEIINFVSSHTLNGELCRVREEGNADSKFYVLADRGYIFSASIFLGESKSGQTVFSLSFVMGIDAMERYLSLQHFLNRQTGLLVTKFRVLQEKEKMKESVTEFDVYLQKLVAAVETLENNKILYQHVCIKDTLFTTNDFISEAKSDDLKFLMRAVTSHLQTGGSTVVVGKQIEHVNLMTNTLAMLLSPNERACSRTANVNANFGYERDLFVQGLLYNSSGELSIESKDVILSSLPTTLINVRSKEVKQNGELQNHFDTRLKFLKLELHQMFKDEEMIPFPMKELFNDAENIAIMVQHFVSEMLAIPNLCSVRETYLNNFLKLLQQKSTTLFSYVEAKSLRGVDPLTSTDIRQMKHDLSLDSEADFRIILAQTEKLHPGFVSFLFGNLTSEATYQAIRTTYVEVI